MHGSSDMKVTVEKDRILEILKSNREKHIANYEKAKAGYKQRAISLLKSAIMKFEAFDPKTSKLPVLDFGKCPKPVCYADEYTRAIGMLELHAEPKMVIDMSAYRKFVEDQWDWKNQFDVLNSSYLGEAVDAEF